MKMPGQARSDLRAMFQESGVLERADAVAESYRLFKLTPKRFRWDLFYALPRAERSAWFAVHSIYDSMNDDHIDTALREILPQTWEINQ